MFTADRIRQVFSHLTPKDIINLSRTSRVFRDTLMTRNATSVWKASRERLGAPECPSNMSEPQWAVLLFGNVCQVRRSNGSSHTLCLNEKPPRVVAQKTYTRPSLASCVGSARAARRESKLPVSLAITVRSFSFSLLLESRFKTRFPDIEPEILEFIPYTNGQHLLSCICMDELI